MIDTSDTRPYVASDLEWVISSPLLTKARPEFDLASLPETAALLVSVKDNPDPLIEFLTGMKRYNLGTYFEHLVFYWLSNIAPVTVLATNLQIRDETKTHGELDLLFSYAGEVNHWELAIKFYASTATSELEENWVGPLKKDNLKRKLDRLFDHQLPLCTTEVAKKTLDLSEIKSGPIKSSPFVKGVLFEKAKTTEAKTTLPGRVAEDCEIQFWCTISDLQANLADDIDRYCILPKMRWMSRLLDTDWRIWDGRNTHQALTEILIKTNRPQYIAFGKSGGDRVIEQRRIFVMSEDWESLPTL
ncbi:MAG: DUF1853 family protein [Pseudomonas marincola]